MVEIKRFGEEALIVTFEEEISISIHLKVKKLYQILQKESSKGIVSLSPAYQSVTVVFNPLVTDFDQLKSTIKVILENLSFDKPSEKKVVSIPVCYDLSMDMEEVNNITGLSKEEIIHLHTSTDYLVYFSGFAPGFLYLGGLNEKLRVPRKKTPRIKVLAGAVGLADLQTGIYPLDTPGGWQIIGQTPVKMINLLFKRPVELGTFIRFYSISKQEFKLLNEKKEFLPSINTEPWLA